MDTSSSHHSLGQTSIPVFKIVHRCTILIFTTNNVFLVLKIVNSAPIALFVKSVSQATFSYNKQVNVLILMHHINALPPTSTHILPINVCLVNLIATNAITPRFVPDVQDRHI